ncbi:MAG TPA: hypothetical protein DGH68_12145 [Bacteroidetes bacterium]|nr:hypothetical protein [Bacteroidota bacterium]
MSTYPTTSGTVGPSAQPSPASTVEYRNAAPPPIDPSGAALVSLANSQKQMQPAHEYGRAAMITTVDLLHEQQLLHRCEVG